MPRTILGLINRNRRFNYELSPYKRGKIISIVSQGDSFVDAGKPVYSLSLTARVTVKYNTERLDN
jgi:tricorn protease-like protein